ncbi:MAG: VanZ family protein [Candidatus Thiodiazotropha sp. (ex Notomyrtea botanica)]|nr:VanZ family protein [Candidatus Thiodiazotropha sp. (ex Notomyrtea botanica)]
MTLVLVGYLSFGQLEETPVADINDKFGHVAAFLCLAFLLDFAWPKHHWGLYKLLPLLAYGLFIELVQHYLPYRNFSLWDLAADGLGLFLYPLSLPILKRIPILAVRWNSATN